MKQWTFDQMREVMDMAEAMAGAIPGVLKVKAGKNFTDRVHNGENWGIFVLLKALVLQITFFCAPRLS